MSVDDAFVRWWLIPRALTKCVHCVVWWLSCRATGFNLALIILSPLAGVMAERLAVRRLLNMTTLLRGVLYVILLPAAWVMLQTNWVIASQEYFNSGMTAHVDLAVVCASSGRAGCWVSGTFADFVEFLLWAMCV